MARKTVGQRLQAAAAKLRLPTHAERQRIIEAPLPVVQVVAKHTWGGTFIRESVPTEGRRVWANQPEDEEWCRNKWEEK